MPLYRVRRERCIPYEIVVNSSSVREAELAAYNSEDKWEEGSAYWHDLETLVLREEQKDTQLPLFPLSLFVPEHVMEEES